MTVADLISHLRECDPAADVEVDLEQAYLRHGDQGLRSLRGRARGALVALTSGNRDGQEVVILNAQEQEEA